MILVQKYKDLSNRKKRNTNYVTCQFEMHHIIIIIAFLHCMLACFEILLMISGTCNNITKKI